MYLSSCSTCTVAGLRLLVEVDDGAAGGRWWTVCVGEDEPPFAGEETPAVAVKPSRFVSRCIALRNSCSRSQSNILSL